MHLTNSEYQAFKSRFQSIHWPDEKFRVPIEVETPDGKSAWLEYVSANQFTDAAKWIEALRGTSRKEESESESKPSPPPRQPIKVDLKPRSS